MAIDFMAFALDLTTLDSEHLNDTLEVVEVKILEFER